MNELAYILTTIVSVLGLISSNESITKSKFGKYLTKGLLGLTLLGGIIGFLVLRSENADAIIAEDRSISQSNSINSIDSTLQVRIDSINKILSNTKDMVKSLSLIEDETKGLLIDRQNTLDQMESLNKVSRAQLDLEQEKFDKQHPEIFVDTDMIYFKRKKHGRDSIGIFFQNINDRIAYNFKSKIYILFGSRSPKQNFAFATDKLVNTEYKEQYIFPHKSIGILIDVEEEIKSLKRSEKEFMVNGNVDDLIVVIQVSYVDNYNSKKYHRQFMFSWQKENELFFYLLDSDENIEALTKTISESTFDFSLFKNNN